jgi:tRNA G18 (ribose-2'-O)-methylase SpoU
MHEKKYDLVSDKRDSRYLTFRSLQTPQGRSRTGCYVIEGIRHLARAVEAHADIKSIFVDPSGLSNHFGQKLARRLRKQGVPGVRLSHDLYGSLSMANEPQGIGAVVRQEWIPLNGVTVARRSLWLAIECSDLFDALFMNL